MDIIIYLIQEAINLKRPFIIANIIGIIIILILSFIIPKNPFENIPALTYRSFDKPLWSCYFISGSFIYTLLVWKIYDIFLPIYKRM